MNPFALHGFSFLLFYLMLATVALFFLRFWINYNETKNAAPTPTMTDPYLIAYLRAGENEAMRVATVSLLDRGLLVAEGGNLSTKSRSSVELVKRPIERAILKHFLKKGEAFEVLKTSDAKRACVEYEHSLRQHGMLSDAGTYVQRLGPAFVIGATLLGVALIKINIALSEGLRNVGFLKFLAFVVVVVIFLICRKRLTGRGSAMIKDLRDLFSRLKGRAKTLRAGGATNEAALLAAVFGISALPVDGFPFMEKLYPKKASDSSSCGSGCGSSSSCSSGGSSCGGGCGGGGCGG